MPGERLSTGLRLSAAGLLAAAVAATAAPAHADTPIGNIDVYPQDLTIGASGPGADLPIGFSINPATGPTETFTNVTLSIDTSALAGVATATSADSRCSASGTEINCALGTVTTSDFISSFTTVDIHVKAASGAVAGQSGQLTMTGSADGIPPAPAFQPSTITLADGPDLVTPTTSQAFTGVTRGSTITMPHITLDNVGSQSAEGVTMVFMAPYEFPITHLARNCEYASYPTTGIGWTVASCYFDNVIQPGATYTLKRPQQSTVRADSIFGFRSFISLQAFPGYQPPSAAAPGLTFVRGTEQQLRLDKTSDGGTSTTTSTQVTQANLNQGDGVFTQKYQVDDGVSSDLAAIGDSVTAAAGSTVPVTIGVKENGPGSLDFGPTGISAAEITFTPPPGTTVTSIPDGCSLNGDGVTYLCNSNLLLVVGASQTFTFQLQVSAGGTTGAGSVNVIHSSEGPPPTGPDVYDTTWDNNNAPVTIDP
jgi:hypothetical protein